jgi:hypothetical protein
MEMHRHDGKNNQWLLSRTEYCLFIIPSVLRKRNRKTSRSHELAFETHERTMSEYLTCVR